MQRQLRKCANATTDAGGERLREYIRCGLEVLVEVSEKTLARGDCQLSRRDRLLLRELDSLLRRSRYASSQETVLSDAQLGEVRHRVRKSIVGGRKPSAIATNGGGAEA
jgi:hypothetical protein